MFYCHLRNYLFNIWIHICSVYRYGMQYYFNCILGYFVFEFWTEFMALNLCDAWNRKYLEFVWCLEKSAIYKKNVYSNVTDIFYIYVLVMYVDIILYSQHTLCNIHIFLCESHFRNECWIILYAIFFHEVNMTFFVIGYSHLFFVIHLMVGMCW